MDRAPTAVSTIAFHPRAGEPALARRLAREIEGEVLFDAASRGRYSTDASIYQIDPVGVVVAKTEQDVCIALQIAAEEGIPVLPRGAGSSQCGQTVGAALVIDHSRHLNRVVSFDRDAASAVVQPGVVLDGLNAFLKPHGLSFPVDVSTSAQATLGGMAGNNSCGSRSIRYGNMVHNVRGIDAILADGSEHHFGPYAPGAGSASYRGLVGKVLAIVEREAAEIEARWPKVLRRVQGYNLDMLLPGGGRTIAPAGTPNLAHLLVGSEGTLAWSKQIHLKLSPLPRHRTLGVCHFDSFYRSMEAPQHIVKLGPSAVELMDRTMMDLARSNPAFAGTIAQFIRGNPAAILLTEFSGDDREEQLRSLARLSELMADLGHPGSVIEITDAALQREVWEVRKAGLNIMMSMKGDGKPVSFIEDCAVPLENLAEYTERLTQVFHKHGTEGTWYAHASVGTLHVRPILNMKTDGAAKMRAIAEEACALVRSYKGAAYSGEHGDGLVRSEWIEPIIGPRLAAALGEIKSLFDPRDLMNPGKIVRPSKQDERTLFRYKPGYRTPEVVGGLDWSEWDAPGAAQAGARSNPARGLAAAVEMCNNNGHCRKFDAGTMCPSFRATGNERDLTRGRANTLRLALSGQLGGQLGGRFGGPRGEPSGGQPAAAGQGAAHAWANEEVYRVLDLCVSCKGCKRECPTGVDMARMKIEFLHHYHRDRPRALGERLTAHLPRYAAWGARLSGLLALRESIPGAAALGERLFGLSAKRSLPRFHARPFLSRPESAAASAGPSGEVALFVDTFNNWFEPENAHAARVVLEAAGYGVHCAGASASQRPLCCGRTYLARGMIDEARAEARRMLDALAPLLERGLPIIGLEPACLYSLIDEWSVLGLGPSAQAAASSAVMFEEFLERGLAANRAALRLNPIERSQALLHGHCHQKAFGAMPAVERLLKRVPGLAVRSIESSCCGMAGNFGYEARHYEVSMRMGELSLLPAVREAGEDALIVADGTSCRHQIADGAKREAWHVARVLERSLAARE